MRTFLTQKRSPFGDRTQRRVGGRTVPTKSGRHDTPSLANSWAGVLLRGIASSDQADALQGRDDPSDCHLLFISRARRAQVDDVLARLEKAPVLTVSEIDQFAHRGGMINFIRHERTFRFAINVEAAERAGLRISSRLASMVTVVKTTPP